MCGIERETAWSYQEELKTENERLRDVVAAAQRYREEWDKGFIERQALGDVRYEARSALFRAVEAVAAVVSGTPPPEEQT